MRAQSLLILALMLVATTAWGDNFRVTTELSEGDEVYGRSNTIFFQGRVFDVSDPKGNEFTVYDPTQKRIRLINVKHKMQTWLATKDIERYTAELKVIASQKAKRPFNVDPEFKDESNEQRIRLTSETISYEAEVTKPRFQQAGVEYRQFADWMCQLNAMNPRNLPPFARMKLNEALGARNVLPLRVQLRLVIDAKERVVSSKHRYYWVLSRDDRELCEKVGGYLADPKIELVDFKTYRAAKAVALKR